MNASFFLNAIRILIVQGDLDQALQQLQKFLEGTPHLDEALHQSGRFAAIRQQIRLGTVSHADATLTRNQISAGLLELLREIEEVEGRSPEIRAEIANQTYITGDHNIVIQNVTGSTITINQDGKFLQLDRKLDALMALLTERQAQSIQTADKIYNIGAITNATFEMIVGQAVPNLSLPANLAHEMIKDDQFWIQGLRDELLELRPSVSVGEEFETVFQHYGWLIETFLQKMCSAPGREHTHRRLAFMAEAYQSALRYLCTIQLSQIFKQELQTNKAVIAEFIALDPQASSRYDYLSLLLLSSEWIPREDAFMTEIYDFLDELQDPHSDLYGAALFLEKYRHELLNGKAPQGDALNGLLEEYLTALAFWLRKLAFLAHYRLVSIKDISLNYRLGTAKNFEHTYGELHGIFEDTKFDYRSQRIEDLFTYNKSVLLFRGRSMHECFESIHDPNSYLSLSPLLVDQSVFADKTTQTPEIFYFSGFDGEERKYCFAYYKNELIYDSKRDHPSKFLLVGVQNTKDSRLNELYKQLQKIFTPLKSPAR